MERRGNTYQRIRCSNEIPGFGQSTANQTPLVAMVFTDQRSGGYISRLTYAQPESHAAVQYILSIAMHRLRTSEAELTVMLITAGAGGAGLNIDSASVVIQARPWWVATEEWQGC